MAMGSSEVDLSLRLQVLLKIRDYAGNDFYQAWASNLEAMDIIRDWLKSAVTSRTGEWDETVMPLLHVRCFHVSSHVALSAFGSLRNMPPTC